MCVYFEIVLFYGTNAMDLYRTTEITKTDYETTTQAQFECLVQFMRQNPDIEANDDEWIEIDTTELWKQLNKELNDMGPPIRTIDGWKQVIGVNLII